MLNLDKDKKHELVYVLVLTALLMSTGVVAALLGSSHHMVWMAVVFVVGVIAAIVWMIIAG